jgi:hypothetical protein
MALSALWLAVSFARTGNPNHRGLADWPVFDAARRSTMVFDRESRAISDPLNLNIGNDDPADAKRRIARFVDEFNSHGQRLADNMRL